MKEQFKNYRFQETSASVVINCQNIIENYLAQGLRLTLRQLYYQFISLDLFPNEWVDSITKSKNNEKSYGRLSTIVSNARLAGILDWDTIEDRIRVPKIPSEFKNLTDLVEAANQSYRLPRWKDQPWYVELWVEKDALAGVLSPLAHKYHITLMVNRGYSSQTAMYGASKRFIYHIKKKCALLYLGDFDPSGEDMVRDIQERLTMFGAPVGVVKLALTLDQIKQYNPPPNPAKLTDPRAEEFINKYGASSWEVDAINPFELQQIIEKAILKFLNKRKWDKILKQERLDKEYLMKSSTKYLQIGER